MRPGDVTSHLPARIDEIGMAVMSTSFNPKHMLLSHTAIHCTKIDAQEVEWDESSGTEQQMTAFNALLYASKLYTTMEGASISIEVIEHPIHAVEWAQDQRTMFRDGTYPRSQSLGAVLAKSFACLA